jgi:hypothetical protein
MANTTVLVVASFTATAILSSWVYFRCFRLTRPPIGVFNLRDIAVMIAGIVLTPYLYLLVPVWLVASLLASANLSVLYTLWEPIVRTRWAIWLATLACVGAEVGAAFWFGTRSQAFLAVHNVVLVLAVVGVSNLWAQGGMQARDLAVLAGALAIYDAIASWLLPLMTDLFSRVANLAFTPLVAWPLGRARLWLGLGLGDLLIAAVFPLVMRKAFGRRAGIMALATSLGVIGALLVLTLPGLKELGSLQAGFPVMVALGPLIVLHYYYWRHRCGRERTTWQYQQAEPAIRHQ